MWRRLLIGSLAALGALALFQLAPPTAAQLTARYFPETHHWVRGPFLKYWEDHGGLAQQGYPLTEEFQEVNKLNGKTYTVQYFERAIFEKHPENAPPYDVLLSQLGTFELDSRYPHGSNPAASPVPGQAPPAFYEDRTGGVELMKSYYNAINRGEYQRAFGYWEPGAAAGPPSYAQFVQGFADTLAVSLQTGTPQSQGAAGHIFTTVPVVLVATHTDTSTQTFYGCYTTRHTSPGIDPNPNATLERIFNAKIQPAPPNVSVATLLAQGCAGQ